MDDISGLHQEKVREEKKEVSSLCEFLRPVILYFECVCGCS